jgi:hypothetical protein
MNWDNYGFYGWHIDHIRPCASFDLSKPSEQRKCFNYTNLQPLWATENWGKRDSLIMVKHNPKTNWKKSETTYIAVNLDK